LSHLLDTNAFVDHLRRGPASKVTAKLLAAPSGSTYLCSVVLGELIFGAVRSGAAHEAANRTLIAGLRASFPILLFDEPAAEEYGRLRAYLTNMGQVLGPNDLMIASIALANGKTVVTHNTKEFSRVPGLTWEDWQ
jgi:tRNA(fMet)-specific endonuclease VapC